MKKLFSLIFTLCLAGTSTFADKPPLPKKPLSERVNLATHVFIGKAKSLRAVREVAGTMQELKPEPTHTGTASGVMVELDVEVQEVMFPASWNPSVTVKVYFGGGIFSIEKLREYFLANEYVYLTKDVSLNGERLFIPSYPWSLTEGLDKKQEIIAVLEKRVTN